MILLKGTVLAFSSLHWKLDYLAESNLLSNFSAKFDQKSPWWCCKCVFAKPLSKPYKSERMLNSIVLKCSFSLQRCRITIFGIFVSGREKLRGVRESSIFFETLFLRKQILVSSEQSHGLAPYAVFKASTFETTVLQTGRKERKGWFLITAISWTVSLFCCQDSKKPKSLQTLNSKGDPRHILFLVKGSAISLLGQKSEVPLHQLQRKKVIWMLMKDRSFMVTEKQRLYR